MGEIEETKKKEWKKDKGDKNGVDFRNDFCDEAETRRRRAQDSFEGGHTSNGLERKKERKNEKKRKKETNKERKKERKKEKQKR